MRYFLYQAQWKKFLSRFLANFPAIFPAIFLAKCPFTKEICIQKFKITPGKIIGSAGIPEPENLKDLGRVEHQYIWQ